MPSSSEKQRRFFQLVKAIQEGKKVRASGHAKAVAKTMKKKDVRDFAAAVEPKSEAENQESEINMNTSTNKSATNIDGSWLAQAAALSGLTGMGLAGLYGLSKYMGDKYALPEQISKAKNQMDQATNVYNDEDAEIEQQVIESVDESTDSAPLLEEANNDDYNSVINPEFENRLLKQSSGDVIPYWPNSPIEYESLAKGLAVPLAVLAPALVTYHFTKKFIDHKRNKSLSNQVRAAKQEFEEILSKKSSELQTKVDNLYTSTKEAGGTPTRFSPGGFGLREGTYDGETGKPINVNMGPGGDNLGGIFLAGSLLSTGALASYLLLRNKLKSDEDTKKVKALRNILRKDLAASALESGIKIKEEPDGNKSIAI